LFALTKLFRPCATAPPFVSNPDECSPVRWRFVGYRPGHTPN
jgi:hypothetical protein